MIKHFCDICEKEIKEKDLTAAQRMHISIDKDNLRYGSSLHAVTSEIGTLCDECLRLIVDIIKTRKPKEV